jgi:hypothetical protein
MKQTITESRLRLEPTVLSACRSTATGRLSVQRACRGAYRYAQAGIAVFLLGATANSSAFTPPSALEMTQLPQYCWGQFDKKFAGLPGYTISNCGGGMNHFCMGLVYMLRANKPGTPRSQKIGPITQARVELQYTIDRMAPNCPISADVQAAELRLRVMEAGVGIQPRR